MIQSPSQTRHRPDQIRPQVNGTSPLRPVSNPVETAVNPFDQGLTDRPQGEDTFSWNVIHGTKDLFTTRRDSCQEPQGEIQGNANGLSKPAAPPDQVLESIRSGLFNEVLLLESTITRSALSPNRGSTARSAPNNEVTTCAPPPAASGEIATADTELSLPAVKHHHYDQYLRSLLSLRKELTTKQSTHVTLLTTLHEKLAQSEDQYKRRCQSAEMLESILRCFEDVPGDCSLPMVADEPPDDEADEMANAERAFWGTRDSLQREFRPWLTPWKESAKDKADQIQHLKTQRDQFSDMLRKIEDQQRDIEKECETCESILRGIRESEQDS